MSFDEGMKLFRSGDIPGACEQFHQAVEQNALMLDPGNATYVKNQEKNEAKRPVNWQVRPKQEAKEDPKPYTVPAQVEKPLTYYLVTAAKLLGGFLLFCFILMVISAFLFGMSEGVADKSKEQVSLAGNAVTFQPTQQVTKEPTTYYFDGATSGSTDYFYLERGMVDILFNVGNEYYNGGTLKDGSGQYVDLIINQVKPGSGNKKVRVPKSGNYYIDMASENWNLKIIQ